MKTDVYGPFRRKLPIGDFMRKFIMRRPMSRIMDALLDAGVDSVLDVGCGTGVLARKLSDGGFRVTGMEKWAPKIGQCYKVESGLIKGIPKHGQTT